MKNFLFQRRSKSSLILGISTIGYYSMNLLFSEASERAVEPADVKAATNATEAVKIKKLDDCQIPACASTVKMFKSMLQKNQEQQQQQQHHKQHVHNPYTTGCPVMREQLGVSSWNLIHTIAANYPDNPDEIYKENVRKFFESLSFLYPCPLCAEDFRVSVLNNPPKVSSREELSLWCCELHNDVNKKLGLPVFPCSITELDIRWRIGRDECWKEGDENSSK